jgi:hypothetical protein
MVALELGSLNAANLDWKALRKQRKLASKF